MSGILFLVILCSVLAYILYDNAQRNRRLAQARNSKNIPNASNTSASANPNSQHSGSSVLRKNQDYLLQSKILTQMAKEKTDSAYLSPSGLKSNKHNNPKISIHWRAETPAPTDLLPLLSRISQSFDLYFIISLDNQHREAEQKRTAPFLQVVSPKKIFKCKTQEGLHAVIRQLGARIHIESELPVIRGLKAYLHTVATIGRVVQDDPTVLKSSSNVYSFQNLGEILNSLEKLLV